MHLRQPIHILGIGNLGKLVAHSLRKSHPETPITLLFHRPSLVEEWNKAGQFIEIVRNGEPDRQSGYSYELVSKEQSTIRNLVVATKAYATVQALKPLRDRLAPLSTLLFLQNGIGTIDEVTSSLFNQSSRPNYLSGILNHGVYTTGPFSAVHAGFADTILGPALPPSTEASTGSRQEETSFLIQQILSATMLAASLVSPSELLQAQLQKLAVNAIINPLTVIFDCFNGELFHNTAIRVLIQAIISELSAVIHAIITSRNGNLDPAISARFSPENLEKIISGVGAKTAKNISSMRQDVRAGRMTEIDYINGYIIAQGAEYGIKCPQNSKLMDLVKEKTLISKSQIPGVFRI
ncbi:MAG: hypothetical protein M1840_007078 [Geoglossum simile]|nr:MAG: hypothetical protein M1840_007078 [Geoglossum simile]